MTLDSMTQDKDAADKLLDHNRQQLSALMDGELSPDEARFLLRRLQHDESLAQSLSHWQLCGDILRGQVHAPAPAGFARGVAAAIANDRDASAVARPAAGWRPARWGTGLALAASVAVVALFVGRQTPEMATPEGASQSTQLAVQGQSDQTQPDPVETIAKTTPAASPPNLPTGSVPNPQQPEAPGTAAGVAAVAAVAELPRRAAARRSRGQSQRAATRSAARRNAELQVAVAAAAQVPMAPRPASATHAAQSQTVSEMAVAAAGDHPSTANGSTASPFMPKTDISTTRPWPRALLPAAPAGGFNVDYGRQQGTKNGFYPFQLRAVPDRGQQVPAGQGNDAPATVEPADAQQAAMEHAGGDTP